MPRRKKANDHKEDEDEEDEPPRKISKKEARAQAIQRAKQAMEADRQKVQAVKSKKQKASHSPSTTAASSPPPPAKRSKPTPTKRTPTKPVAASLPSKAPSSSNSKAQTRQAAIQRAKASMAADRQKVQAVKKQQHKTTGKHKSPAKSTKQDPPVMPPSLQATKQSKKKKREDDDDDKEEDDDDDTNILNGEEQVTTDEPQDTTPNTKKRNWWKWLGTVFAISRIVAFVVYARYGYPQERVLTWHQISTDGWAPDWLAHQAQAYLGGFWQVALQQQQQQRRRDVYGMKNADNSQALLNELHRLLKGVSCSNDTPGESKGYMVDLAAGHGVASRAWRQWLQDQHGLNVPLVITDPQPDVEYWQQEQQEQSSKDWSQDVHVVETPVEDPLQPVLPASFPKRRQQEVRMMHLALHRFTPTQVQALIQDTVNQHAALLISDISPSAGSLLFAPWLLGPLHLRSTLWEMVQHDPWKVVPLSPLLVLVGMHDVLVSVLRSYSWLQLVEFVEQATQGEGSLEYEVQTFQSGSYGTWLGLDEKWVRPLQDPVIQYFWLAPKTIAGGGCDDSTDL